MKQPGSAGNVIVEAFPSFAQSLLLTPILEPAAFYLAHTHTHTHTHTVYR
jgi:hypothetical protein